MGSKRNRKTTRKYYSFYYLLLREKTEYSTFINKGKNIFSAQFHSRVIGTH